MKQNRKNWFSLFGVIMMLLFMAMIGEAKKASDSFPEIALEPVISGLNKPLNLVASPDGTGRLFVEEQEGKIKVWQGGRVLPVPFLDLSDKVSSGNEEGLLGLAFHPQFQKNKRFFVNYTSPENGLHTVISEFKVSEEDPNLADKQSERIILTVQQPYSNHNGGNLVFGPDGYLYIGLGDGGSGNDPHGNGQNLSVLLGKMLRIDVDKEENGQAYGIPKDNPYVGREGLRGEIWAYGLRNPWRYSFDAGTGWLYCGDVGQNHWEEVDVVKKGKNYGWNIMEGTHPTPGVNPHGSKKGLVPPIIDYPRNEGTCVTGGFVYRGHACPKLKGAYIYGDYVAGKIWALRYNGRKVSGHKLLLKTGRNFSSFGVDWNGELYVVDHSGGEVLKIACPR